MKTIPLGDTGVEVSAMCLGTMLFGGRDAEDISYPLADQYVEAGGTFLDTANMYCYPGTGGSDSETLLGKWMKERRNRSRLFIATKVGAGYPGVERGLRSHQIEVECEKSLKKLGIETIDLYYAHMDDRETPLEETLEAFDRLVQLARFALLGRVIIGHGV